MSTTETYSGPITYESDFSWYEHASYEKAIEALPIRGERGRIKVLRVEEKCFPERLIKEVNFLWDNGLDAKQLVEKARDQSIPNKLGDNDMKWPGISAIIVNDDPLNNWVYVIEFPDGSQGLLRRLGRIVLKRTQRVWIKPTDRPGLYDPFGEYDRCGKRIA